MLIAVACDLRTRRIPNPLVVAGIALGLLFQAVTPTGSGLFAASAGAASFGSALLGGVLGLAMFMPFYALRAFGAGDVKLLAMAGVWLGAGSVLWAGLWTLVAGGLLSLAWALGTGVLRQVFANLQFMLIERIVRVGSAAAPSRSKRRTRPAACRIRSRSHAAPASRSRGNCCARREPTRIRNDLTRDSASDAERRDGAGRRHRRDAPPRHGSPAAARTAARTAHAGGNGPVEPDAVRAGAEGDVPARHHAPARAGESSEARRRVAGVAVRRPAQGGARRDATSRRPRRRRDLRPDAGRPRTRHRSARAQQVLRGRAGAARRLRRSRAGAERRPTWA